MSATEFDYKEFEAKTSVQLTRSDKRVVKEEIRKTLQALVELIRISYPDNYEAMLRSWGFEPC